MASYTIGIAEKIIAKSPDKMVTLGLGSCVGLIIYDPKKKICGMVHIMLPNAPAGDFAGNKFKFADTAVPEMIRLVTMAGATRSHLIAKFAGGAHMFNNIYKTDVMGIGQRNAETCRQLLAQNHIPVISHETGGTSGRSIEFCCDSNMLQIRTVSPQSVRLI